jgi:hypothetical protein
MLQIMQLPGVISTDILGTLSLNSWERFLVTFQASDASQFSLLGEGFYMVSL